MTYPTRKKHLVKNKLTAEITLFAESKNLLLSDTQKV